jgi:hypothetical protein
MASTHASRQALFTERLRLSSTPAIHSRKNRDPFGKGMPPSRNQRGRAHRLPDLAFASGCNRRRGSRQPLLEPRAFQPRRYRAALAGCKLARSFFARLARTSEAVTARADELEIVIDGDCHRCSTVPRRPRSRGRQAARWYLSPPLAVACSLDLCDSTSASTSPIRRRNWSRPREIRDRTVPTGIWRIEAISS